MIAQFWSHFKGETLSLKPRAQEDWVENQSLNKGYNWAVSQTGLTLLHHLFSENSIKNSKKKKIEFMNHVIFMWLKSKRKFHVPHNVLNNYDTKY